MVGAGTQAHETVIKEDLCNSAVTIPSPLFGRGAPIESYNP